MGFQWLFTGSFMDFYGNGGAYCRRAAVFSLLRLYGYSAHSAVGVTGGERHQTMAPGLSPNAVVTIDLRRTQ